jgi:tetratricopeptide (TPR) repeat protein
MRPTLLLATAALLSASAYPYQESRAWGARAEAYIETINMYRQGRLTAATSEMRGKDPKEITAAVEELKQSPVSDKDLWAAIFLHTELAVTAPVMGDLGGRDFHLQMTSELVQMCSNRFSFQRRWLLAMGYYYLSQLEEDLATASLEEALELSPEDDEILVALGSVRETMSLMQVGNSSETLSPSDGALPPTNSSEYRSMLAKLRGYSVSQTQLEAAESFYRKALELEGKNAEAHLRLGRVLQQTGREDEALRELSWVTENSRDRFLKGTAHLFTGRLLEGRQQYEDALLHFREAVSLQPHWQVAQIALGHTLHRTGERRSSKEIIEEAIRPKQGSKQGGLWHYYFCRDRFIDAIRQMRREILL